MAEHCTAHLDVRKQSDGLKVYVTMFGLNDFSYRLLLRGWVASEVVVSRTLEFSNPQVWNDHYPFTDPLMADEAEPTKKIYVVLYMD